MSISEWTFWFLGGHSVDKCTIELHHAASSSQTHADETLTGSYLSAQELRPARLIENLVAPFNTLKEARGGEEGRAATM